LVHNVLPHISRSELCFSELLFLTWHCRDQRYVTGKMSDVWWEEMHPLKKSD
jgi:hypothetical protein